jgi:hypothetical protein
LSEKPDATHHSQQPEQWVTSWHFPESYNLRVECKENDPLNQLAAVVLLLQRDVGDLTLKGLTLWITYRMRIVGSFQTAITG